MGSGDPFYPRIDYIFDSDEFSMVCCVYRRRREGQCSLLAAAAALRRLRRNCRLSMPSSMTRAGDLQRYVRKHRGGRKCGGRSK